MIKLKKVTKFYAPQIYNTWAKTGYLYEFEKIASYNFYLYLFYAQTNNGIDLKKPIIIYKGYHPGETTVIKVKIKDN